MPFLQLANISKRFGPATAVSDIDLAINQGEFLTLLGPSGCGKTTILRMIAGFESPSTGTITLDGENITNRSANKRPMGMIFQSYALFPHLTAAQNIAFGMQIKRLPQKQIQQRCSELLDLVGLGEMGSRYPHQLSGGQQQRIAIARALAVEPKVLLLDEPLSALDAKVRVSLRNEIRRIQQQLTMTAIYVTHDQEEALAISDRIAVMANGHIEQLDAPEQLYSHPRSLFAATFVGNSNQFNATIQSATAGSCKVGDRVFITPPLPHLHNDTPILIIVRPEEISLSPTTPENTTIPDRVTHNDNQLTGIIELRTFLGPFTRFHIRTDNLINNQTDDHSDNPTSNHTTLIADIPNHLSRDFKLNQPVQLSFPPAACQVFPNTPHNTDQQALQTAKIS